MGDKLLINYSSGMKNETKLNDSKVIQTKLPARNTRPQKESESLDPDARRRASLEYFEHIRIAREYGRDILGLTKGQARMYASSLSWD